MLASEQKTQQLFNLISASERVFQRPISRELVHKVNAGQVVIGDIKPLDMNDVSDYFDLDGIDANRVFYGLAYPNLECEVCFDHPLDHYPLMMIFEMGRQFGIAASHKFYDVPLEGFINIVDSLNFEFKTFLELDKPVYIVCADSDVKDKSGIHRRHMDLAFIQEGVHCASGAGNVSVFRKSLYKRMRMSSRRKIVPADASGASIIPTNRDILDASHKATAVNV